MAKYPTQRAVLKQREEDAARAELVVLNWMPKKKESNSKKRYEN
jgi:hypothetical protein